MLVSRHTGSRPLESKKFPLYLRQLAFITAIMTRRVARRSSGFCPKAATVIADGAATSALQVFHS
ncbi:hypothetical protein [Burkholderia arboris]|uniref:hypothetical protein n=1 Tax=Burkholderia arboris TaxID=488730 RepID=UPI0030F1A7E1